MKQAFYRDADDKAKGAAINAQYRNREMAMTYNPTQLCSAQRAFDLLDTAYSYARSYVNYRKKFIAVKLERQTARNRKTAQEVLSILEDKGYSVVSTPQGLVVRIPR